MANIALINPPSPFLINQRVFPNIGAVRTATALDLAGHDVQLFDFAGDKDYIAKTRALVGDFEHYAFSATTPQFPYVYEMFKTLKRAHPLAKTIIGGPHASAISSLRERNIQDINIKTLSRFDVVFAGEGENVDKIFIPGWQDGGIVRRIDDVPIPDRKFLDTLSYHFQLFGKETANIQTQRGCPFQCNFCCGRNIPMYRNARNHSPERVIQELDQLHEEFGYSSFMWYDDEVNLNPQRLEELCRHLEDRNYQHRGFIRNDLITKHPETVKMMKRAGFVKLCAGVESGSDRVLKAMGKRLTYDISMRARRLVGEAGIHYEAFLMMGHPTETKEDVDLTVKWIREAKPDDFDINILTPYPGSKIYDEAKPSDRYVGFTWEFNGLFFNKLDFSREASYYKGPGGGSATHSRTKNMTYDYLFKRREAIQKSRR